MQREVGIPTVLFKDCRPILPLAISATAVLSSGSRKCLSSHREIITEPEKLQVAEPGFSELKWQVTSAFEKNRCTESFALIIQDFPKAPKLGDTNTVLFLSALLLGSIGSSNKAPGLSPPKKLLMMHQMQAL